MGTFQVGLLLIGTFALLLALSVPVSVSIIISSVVTMASTLSLDLGTFVASQRMVGGVDSFSLLAVPFYILCGVLMNTGGIAQKLIDFAKILVGRIPGGLAHTNILDNTLFGSLSGSSVAASVAIGGVLIPMEEKEGYDKKFAAAVACTGDESAGLCGERIGRLPYKGPQGRTGGVYIVGVSAVLGAGAGERPRP